MTATPKTRWFQYSLRTLLVFVTLSAVPCSWLAVKIQQARRQREAATALEKFGGFLKWSEPSGPTWLRSLLGDDFFRSISVVSLRVTPITDADLEHLKGLSQLRTLFIGGTEVADAGLEHLKGLNQLLVLNLEQTQVTDAGLKHLKGLNQLLVLNLTGTQVTDAGLEHLKGLNQLQQLYLAGTHVTDAGAQRLNEALPNCTILRCIDDETPPQ